MQDSTPNPAQEIRRLFDLMPASGRMSVKIVSQPGQMKTIDCPFPLPWQPDRKITLNFALWSQLSLPQRDLLLLRTVSWLVAIKWFKLDGLQGLVAAGAMATAIELVQADVVGLVAAGGLTALAASRIWRKNRSSESELAADEAAVHVAERRGYSETEAAHYLISAIETVAKLEGRLSLSFTELIRCQNLRTIAGTSPVGVPDGIRMKPEE